VLPEPQMSSVHGPSTKEASSVTFGFAGMAGRCRSDAGRDEGDRQRDQQGQICGSRTSSSPLQVRVRDRRA
jgi:hypothetical protein